MKSTSGAVGLRRLVSFVAGALLAWSAGGCKGPEWQKTCGSPVCDGHHASGTPKCAHDEVVGAACSEDGDICDPGDGCDAKLVCTTDGPIEPSSCPVSLARHKRDIRYLPADDLERLHAEVLATRLARWRYRGGLDDGREHLGFLIDDQPDSASVGAGGDRVDLYGYTSLAVAALQVQARELAAQRERIAALESDLASLLAERREG